MVLRKGILCYRKHENIHHDSTCTSHCARDYSYVYGGQIRILRCLQKCICNVKKHCMNSIYFQLWQHHNHDFRNHLSWFPMTVTVTSVLTFYSFAIWTCSLFPRWNSVHDDDIVFILISLIQHETPLAISTYLIDVNLHICKKGPNWLSKYVLFPSVCNFMSLYRCNGLIQHVTKFTWKHI